MAAARVTGNADMPLDVVATTPVGTVPSKMADEGCSSSSMASTHDIEKPEVQHVSLDPVTVGPNLNVRILVISGQSHTFGFPPSTTIGQVKELVCQNWAKEWDSPETSRPPGPIYLRLLYMGRVLEDHELLSSLNLKAPPDSTIVHLSIRTQLPAPEEPAKKSILPFSIPTLSRPSAPRTPSAQRQQPQSPPPPQPVAAPIQTTASTTVPPTTAPAPAAAPVQSHSRSGPASQPPPSNGPSWGTGRNASAADQHGGGCKCVIQ